MRMRSMCRLIGLLVAAAALAAFSCHMVIQIGNFLVMYHADGTSDGLVSVLDDSNYAGHALFPSGFAAAALQPASKGPIAQTAALRGGHALIGGDAPSTATVPPSPSPAYSVELKPLEVALLLAGLSSAALWARSPSWRSAQLATELTQPAVFVVQEESAAEMPGTWSRRQVLAAAAALPVVPLAPEPVEAADGEVRPDIPVQTEAILTDACQTYGNGGVCGDVLLSNGTIATVQFESKWPTTSGRYGIELEKRTEGGDAAFLHVKTLARGERFEKLKPDWFASAICAVGGRYGKYGAPCDVGIADCDICDKKKGERNFFLDFVTYSPNMVEFPRKAMIRAILAPGSTQDVMLFTVTTPLNRWEEQESTARATLASLEIPRTRKTELKFQPGNDYRTNMSTFSGMVSSGEEPRLDENGFPLDAVTSLNDARRFGLV